MGAAERRQIEAIKRVIDRWCGDPVQLRLVTVLVLAGAGLFLVEVPLAERLAAARTRQSSAARLQRQAEELNQLVGQAREYEGRVAIRSDFVDWQNYVLSKLAHSTATLISLEPRAAESKGPFQIVSMELVARGNSYAEFVDFIDRIEHGERLVRLTHLRLERHQTSIYLTVDLAGIVRGAAAADAKDAKDAKKADDAKASRDARDARDAGAATGSDGGPDAPAAEPDAPEGEPDAADAGEGDDPP